MQVNKHNLFTTPLVTIQHENVDEMNQQLKKMLMARFEKATAKTKDLPRKAKSNHNGWRTTEDLASWQEPGIASLNKLIVASLEQFLRTTGSFNEKKKIKFEYCAWGNVNPQGAYHAVHLHSGYDVSGAYYVEAGDSGIDDPRNGTIAFEDPRLAAAMSPLYGYDYGHTHMIMPRSGLVAVFPSWIKHFVHPYRGETPRICIPFNAKVRFE